MPNSYCPHQAASTRTYNISVVGPRKSGKSCLCNRFTLPHPDFYRTDHSFQLTSSDITNEIINCDSWLYWGCVARKIDDYTVYFRIVEQTEFFDQNDSIPFAVKGCDDPCIDYVPRSCATHLTSPGKLRYICPDQLRDVESFEKEYFPSELEVSGFVLVCDVRYCTNRDSSLFYECSAVDDFVSQEFLNILHKSKKPIILAASKFDTMPSNHMDVQTDVLYKPEYKKLPLIETSAHENVNVEETFLILSKLIDKHRTSKLKIPRYLEVYLSRKAQMQTAYSNFIRLLSKSHVDFLSDWASFMKRYSQQSDVVTHLGLVGTKLAMCDFELFTKHREFILRRNTFARINRTLLSLLPSLEPVRNKSLDEVAQYIRDQDQFSEHFVDINSNVESNSASRNQENRQTSSKAKDVRIPFNLLVEAFPDRECESPLQTYINELTQVELLYQGRARSEAMCYTKHPAFAILHKRFVTEKTAELILPGRPISDFPWLLNSLENIISEDDLYSIYKKFQMELHVWVREGFLDLLLEQTDLFTCAILKYLQKLLQSHGERNIRDYAHQSSSPDVSSGNNFHESSHNYAPLSSTSNSSSLGDVSLYSTPSRFEHIRRALSFSAPPRGAIENHLHWLDSLLSSDWRHEAMSYLPSERQTLIASHFNLLLPSSQLLASTRLNSIQHKKAYGVSPGQSQLKYSSKFYSPGSASLADTPNWRSEISLGRTTSCDPSYYCPSHHWGGCMDTLFKQLAYRLFRVDPLCLETDVTGYPRTIHSTTDLTALSDQLPFFNHRSLTSENDHMLPTIENNSKATHQLTVAVVCVCSDLLAAHAAIHLLACAGFSMSSLLNSTADTQSSFNDFGGSPDCFIEPLIVSASWPLSSSRMPLYDPPKRDFNLPGFHAGFPPHDIPNGQVSATFLSLHKIFNHLLANAVATTLTDFEPDNSKAQVSRDSSEHQFDGFVFVLGAPSEERNDLRSKDAASTLHSVASEDSVQTPRPQSDLVFFPTANTCASPYSHQSTMQQPLADVTCNCCSLPGLCNPPKEVAVDCACAVCCNCLGGNLRANKLSSTDNIFPVNSQTVLYRSRDWNARLSSVRTAINLFPQNCPYLILLAENDKEQEGFPKVTVAPDDILDLSENSEQCEPFTIIRPGEVDSGGNSPDHMRQSSTELPGLNIIDHVIAFLDRCWSHVDKTKFPRYSDGPPSVTCSPAFVENDRSGLPSPITVVQKSTLAPSTPAFEKCSSLLQAASATGRRAMHSANVAFKKWSSSAKRRHANGTSPMKPAASPDICGHSMVANPQNDRLKIPPGCDLESAANDYNQPGFTPNQHSSGASLSPTTNESKNRLHAVISKNYAKLVSSTSADSWRQTCSRNTGFFQRSGLRVSLDRPTALRRMALLSGSSLTSRCSVPDCTRLDTTCDQSAFSRSHRTLSSQTLISRVTPPLPLKIPSTSRFSMCAGCLASPATRQDDNFSSPAFEPHVSFPSITSASSVGADCSLVAITPNKQSRARLSCPANPDPVLANVLHKTASGNPAAPYSSNDSPVNRCATPLLSAQEDEEPIYEDLDLIFPPCSTYSANQNFDNTPKRFASTNLFNSVIEPESDYCEPVDALASNSVERHWCSSPCAPYPPSSPNGRDNRSVEQGNSSSECPTVNSTYSHRSRERRRSFSTPEGHSKTTQKSTKFKTSYCLPSLGSRSHTKFGEPVSNGWHCGTEDRLTGRGDHTRSCVFSEYTNQPMGDANPITTGSNSVKPTPNWANDFTNTNPMHSAENHSFPFRYKPVSRFHHHHRWHHADCPHFTLHRPVPQLGDDPPILEPFPMDRDALARFLDEEVTGFTYPKHRPLSSGPIVEAPLFDQARSQPDLAASSPALYTQSLQPVLIGCSDFPSHRLEPSSTNFPARATTSLNQSYSRIHHTERKESKWAKRGRKLNIFSSHRTSGKPCTSIPRGDLGPHCARFENPPTIQSSPVPSPSKSTTGVCRFKCADDSPR